MTHIKNYLPNSEEELNQAFIQTMIDATPFKIGDSVKISEQSTDEKWVITDSDGEPAALLENDTFHTIALIRDIHFYYC